MKKLLGPLLVAATLVAASSLAPLLSPAKAAGAGAAPQPTAMSPGSALGQPERAEQVPNSLVNPAQDGVELDERALQIYKGQYGPVDQSKPLDFKDQPKSVPRNYVAGQLYNVQVLKNYTYVQLIGQMAYYASSLGVQCTYCHNVQNFAYDTSTKRIARTMQIMSNGVQQAWVQPVKNDYPNYAVSGAVGCVTCHRGNPHMSVRWNIVPVQYLNCGNKSTKQAGYVVNSMYSAARSLGVNCLFCHNSADFVSLQYYPTNKIAHRMWAMVDDINHKYLPANIKAVTCYTCHQGAKWPSALVKAGLDQTPVQAVAAHPEVQDNPGAHLASGADQ
ncbi:MAG: photosynthetic reaction center cytochrome c subunit [Candidatus Eremiobacteraeota bacterium]|nr:photosynthetic reaction center cytochrome c subunit [Candidatus Eremiobacteraeota bacterium]